MDREYLYPGTNVLVNRFGIHDFAMLDAVEHGLTLMRGKSVDKIRGKFDERHICVIHRHLFQDIYPWAGELRTVNIFKSDAKFMDAGLLRQGLREFHRTVRRVEPYPSVP